MWDIEVGERLASGGNGVKLEGVSKAQHLIISPELEKELTPAVKAFVLVLLGRIDQERSETHS